MVVVGGGYVACEFAGIMNGLGTQVIQLYRGDQILRGFDDDLRDHVGRRDARPRRRARGRARRRRRSSAAAAGWRCGSTTARRTSSTRCCSPPGGIPNTAGLGLEALGVRLRRERRGRGRRLVADGGAVDLRGRRRHRPACADAGGDRRGAGLRRDGVRRAGRGRSTTDLVPTAIFTRPGGGDRRADRGRGGAARADRDLRDPLPAAGRHAVRPGRADADEARGRRRRAAGCSACTSSGAARRR